MKSVWISLGYNWLCFWQLHSLKFTNHQWWFSCAKVSNLQTWCGLLSVLSKFRVWVFSAAHFGGEKYSLFVLYLSLIILLSLYYCCYLYFYCLAISQFVHMLIAWKQVTSKYLTLFSCWYSILQLEFVPQTSFLFDYQFLLEDKVVSAHSLLRFSVLSSFLVAGLELDFHRFTFTTWFLAYARNLPLSLLLLPWTKFSWLISHLNQQF